MIHLTLLHPLKNTPVQHWNFKDEAVVRIGRGTDNHVVLYSAVVSRHHAELRYNNSQWEIVNMGTNGTYLDGKRITQVNAVNGITVRLARSGPKLQIWFEEEALKRSAASSYFSTTPPPGQLNPMLSNGSSEKTLPGSPDAREQTKLPETLTPLTLTPATSQPISSQPAASNPVAQSLNPESSSDWANSLQDQPTKTPIIQINPPSSSSQIPKFDPVSGKPINVLKQIGDYYLLETVNQGQISITYLAWHRGKTLALKTINGEWKDDPQAKASFEQEARILKDLHHPGLPRLIDFFVVADQPFLAMEMIYGQDLVSYVTAQGPVSEQQAIAWALQICNTLNYLHTLPTPVLHRNLKPTNLIRRTNRHHDYDIALMEVGAGKVVGLDIETHTEMDAYMAPEQQAGQTSLTSDLFSLGPILIYLLTGKNPSKFYQFKAEELRLCVSSIPELSTGLAELIGNLTHPYPDRRYPSAQVLIAAFNNLLQQSP